MPFTRTDILLGVLLPAAVTFAVAILISRLSSRTSVRLAAAPVALVAGFETGYWSLSLGSFVPEYHWHWLPYLIALAAIVGIISQSLGENPVRQVIVLLLLALGCGYFLTPTWEALSPSRPVYLVVWPLLVAGTGACSLMKLQPDQDSERKFVAIVQFLLFFTTTILLALAGSLRFSQIALAMAGGCAGMLTAVVFNLYRDSLAVTIYPVAIALCGSLLIGKVNSRSDIPLVCYLLIPAATVTLCLSGSNILERKFGKRKWIILGSLAVLLCSSSVGIAAWYELGNS